MRERLEISPSGPLQASIRPPGSKSITNRALICAALADGRSRLLGALDSEDTQVMIEALRALGIAIAADWTEKSLAVQGCAGVLPQRAAELHVANSGTTMRFLTAMLAATAGTFRLDGVPRMRQRPIGDLCDALRQLGADVTCESEHDCPPVRISGTGLRGGTATIRGSISSQFLSGLLLAAPLAVGPVQLEVLGELVSQPYVRMTTGIMAAFGVRVEADGLHHYHIPAPQPYQPLEYMIEPDASAASYFWGAAAIAGGTVSVQGLSRQALQGDVAFCDCLEQMGCRVEYGLQHVAVTGGPLRGIRVDMNAISDTVQTLAAVALFADGPTEIRGVEHIRHKETDRIADLAHELRRLGAEVREYPDGLRIEPRPLHAAVVQTYKDHRMAMSLALVGLRIPGIVVDDPGCTAKTYPGYFDDLKIVCQR